MNKSLRDEVEALERDIAKDPRFWSGDLFDIAKRLRSILFRHPPADGVVVPREDAHDSDCAMHNMPAYPNDLCNCSALCSVDRDVLFRLIAYTIKFSEAWPTSADHSDIDEACELGRRYLLKHSQAQADAILAQEPKP